MNAASAIPATSQRTLTCECCGARFGCSLDAERCWCADESYRMPMPEDGSDCLCPDCLRKAAANLKTQRPA